MVEDARGTEQPAVRTKTPRKPKREKGPLPTLIGILFVIALLVGGAIWMIVFALQQWSAASESETAAAPSITTSPAEPAPREPVAPQPDPPPQKIAKPATPAPVQAKPTPIPVTPIPPPKQPVVDPAPEPAPVPAKPKAPARWPVLALQGVIGKGQNGSAIINDQVLAVNEVIEGVRVISVGKQNVELEYEGERRDLKVGMTTP